LGMIGPVPSPSGALQSRRAVDLVPAQFALKV
jgi:hypothetical protein